MREKALECLKFNTWKENDIGSEKIINIVIKAIETEGNNLLTWNNKYGSERNNHKSLYDTKVKERNVSLVQYERLFYNFFLSKIADKEAFDSFIQIAEKKYAYIAYLFFLKNDKEYLPIAPMRFDDIFKRLDINFKTSNQCSWDNYYQYRNIIREVKEFLDEELENEVRLLDAHSFLWIIGGQMQREIDIPNSNKLSDDEKIKELDKKLSKIPNYRKAITRLIQRPSSLSDLIKKKHKHRCMICNRDGFVKKAGDKYAEIHHMI